MNDTISHPRQRAFLAAYAKCGMVARAAKIAGISRDLHYDWKAEQPDYAAAFKRARELAGGALEDEATRRAQLGVKEPFVYRGQVVMHKVGDEEKPLMRRRYSDTLLLAMLRARVPEYRDKQELSGPDGAPIPVEVQQEVDLSRLTDEELILADRLSRKACDPGARRDHPSSREPSKREADAGTADSEGGTPETPTSEDG